uniref:Uncharacterized protein n=1 Tax=Oryza meridionalis TaxID=40149 RepID=A0A0E0F4Z9_9ORYZ
MPPQPPQPAVDDDVLGAPLPPAMEVFITDAVADPLAAGHGGCRRNRTPLPLSLSLTTLAAELLAVVASLSAAAAGSGEQWATATGRAAVLSNLGVESEYQRRDNTTTAARARCRAARQSAVEESEAERHSATVDSES